MVSRRQLAVVCVCVSAVVPSTAAAETQGGSGPLLDDPTLIALAVALAVSPAPEVTEPAPAPITPTPVVELVASVRAKSLVFAEAPRVKVAFSGKGRMRTVWKSERVNLPAQVTPGTVYKDVQVTLTLSCTPDDLAALIIDARRAARGLLIEPDDATATAAPAPAQVTPAAVPSAVPAPAPATEPTPVTTGAANPDATAASGSKT